MMKWPHRLTWNLFTALGSLIITLLIVTSLVVFVLYVRLPDVTTLNDVAMKQPLRIYSSDGQLISEYGALRRAPIALEQVPKPLIQAVLATEDQRYFEHSGVDLVGLMRAAQLLLLTGKKTQGASTITMQVARNFFLTRKKTFSRKINEILLALKIEHNFDKEKILSLYLNKIFLGHRAYGVAAAAYLYYGKSLKALSLAQLAMIAGLPQAPSRDNPISSPERAKIRRNHVLRRMFLAGYIDQTAYRYAISEPITAQYHGLREQVHAPFVAEMVRNALVNEFGTSAYRNGFSVYTTINPALQRQAELSLKKGIDQYQKRHPEASSGAHVEGAIVALRPSDAAVLALTGGYSFEASRFNRAIQARRQAGSAFKPFIYSAALNQGYTLATLFNDAPVVMNSYGEENLWRPHNDTQRFYGPTRLRVGLIKSRNLVSIRMLRQMGVPYTITYLERFHFDPGQLPRSLSLALGSATVSPTQIAGAYCILANGGISVKPYFIDHITYHGELVYQAQRASNLPTRAIPYDNAYLITDTLKDVIKRGTGRGARILGRQDIAGKTGTTNEQKDAWFIGYNSDLVTAVWMGYDQPRSLHEYGAQAALPIWVDFMKVALAGTPEHSLHAPDNMVIVRIDPKTGQPAGSNQRNAVFEVFRQAYAPQHTTPVIEWANHKGALRRSKRSNDSEKDAPSVVSLF